MRLKRQSASRQILSRCIEDLQILVDAPDTTQLRPCRNCHKPCACSESTTCTCQCHSKCDYAAETLSENGSLYPIEPRILPLVFAFNALKVVQPYWSCEGHMQDEKTLFRPPQVWFYSGSLVYVKIINEFVHQLSVDQKLIYPWQIRTVYAEHLWETGFSLEPDTRYIDTPILTKMQDDALKLATVFTPEQLRAVAYEYKNGLTNISSI